MKRLVYPQRAILALVAMLAFGICLSQATHSQEPNRQLVQTNTPAPTANVKRIALVIGNGAYTSAPPLKNPPNDARDIAATLKTLGFDVTSGINVSQKDMKRLIREFGMKLKNGGSGLFYYAGHGVQSKGRNYLIPVDANIQSEAEVEDSGVDAALVLNFMDDAQNGLNIVILDACRNNPFARSFRSATDGLAQVDAPTGTLIAYATAPGRVASDGAAQNGLYTAELLKQMQVPGVSITDMFMRVRAEVMKQTGSKQVPWEASSLVGSFYFSGAPNDSTAATVSSRIDPTAFELSYWDTIKNSTSADDFKAYLERYPQGQFVQLAKNRIANLDAPIKPVESKPAPAKDSATELAFWDSVKNSTNAEDFRAYLEKYPNGAFTELAKNRLAPLEAGEKERVKADEIARNTKSFKGHYLRRGAWTTPGTLIVTPNKIQFAYRPEEKPTVFQCSDLSAAKLEGVFIRDISDPDGQGTMRFEAESSGMAADALAAMKFVCANPGKNFPGVAPNNSSGSLPADSLEGTTGDSLPAELAFWDSVKNSTNIEDFRAYLKRYPQGEFVDLAESRLRPLEAAAAEKEKKERETFKGAYGMNDVGENAPGAFTITQARIVFKYDHGFQIIKECQQFVKAYVKGSSIYDIAETESNKKYWRFDAASPADAVKTLDAMKNVCKGK